MEDTRARWERAFMEAVDFDTWGQVEEALEGYQRLQVAAAAEYVENVLQLPLGRREGIGKLAAGLKLRIQELQAGQERGVGLLGMKALKPFLKDIIVSDVPFPIAGVKAEGMMIPQAADGSGSDKMMADYDEVAPDADGTLRGPSGNAKRGDTTLTIFIEKWGFKEFMHYVEPRIVISVRDENGDPVEPVQETPVGKTNQTYVFFENTAYIQTPLNKLPPGAAIFFEFRHYKMKKAKRSCKAYCYMEMDEIKNGPITLELYKKPAIYKRSKKPSLLTVKPLYLHLDLTVETKK